MAILSETSEVFRDIKEVKVYKLFNDKSTDETKSTAVDITGATKITLLVEAGTGVSGGVVTLEAARTSSYSGTWKSLGSVTTDAASKLFTVSEQSDIPQLYVRARISTAISGGTIDAYLVTHKG